MATPIPTNEACFTLTAVAEATGGPMLQATSRDVVGVAIDSRSVTDGSLFVALRGERHDGHDYLRDAVSAGASAVLVARDTGAHSDLGVGVVAVEDTERALGDLAAAHRRRWGGRVVAITGSAGKTTTKELCANGLVAAGRSVHRTRGNLNNAIGLPMTIFELDDQVNLAVLELGTNSPGEIARLAEIARPDIGAVTMVSAAHTEGLGSVEDVAREKASLLTALHPEGSAVVNGDDGTLMAWADRFGGARTIFFGREPGLDVQLLSHEIDTELRTRCAILLRDRRQELSVCMCLLGEAAALNASAALALLLACGADPDLAVGALEGTTATPGRMSPVLLPSGLRVLDDTYNANPRSTVLALETAAEVRRAIGGRVVAVLGDMKELGERSGDEHAAIGQHAVGLDVAALVLCGPEMKAAAEAAHAARPEMPLVHVGEAALAIDPVRALVQQGDVVLVKGSRSMQMEQIVLALCDVGDGGGAS